MLLPLSLIIFVNASVIASRVTVPKDHLHGLETCSQCHRDGIDISRILSSDTACLNCHSANELSIFVKNLANGQYKNQEKRINTSLQNSSRGMYYDETKIGLTPNKMVVIRAGSFTMGSNERMSDEGPQHDVYLNEYFIDISEVTNGQYKKFINATGRRSPSHFRNRSYPKGKVDHPVVYVNWEDASAYCAWADKRLPTDQEWEKAARGEDGRTYPWGETYEAGNANTPLRWKSLGQFGDTTPVGMFKKGRSPYGLEDMSGNVWEWTASWYRAYPNNVTFSENYGERYKTLKGGSWFDCSFYKCGVSAPVYNRAFFARKVKNDTFGFRCAK